MKTKDTLVEQVRAWAADKKVEELIGEPHLSEIRQGIRDNQLKMLKAEVNDRRLTYVTSKLAPLLAVLGDIDYRIIVTAMDSVSFITRAENLRIAVEFWFEHDQEEEGCSVLIDMNDDFFGAYFYNFDDVIPWVITKTCDFIM